LGSFGPKRLATGIPSTSLQGKFEFIDNAESLLNVTDLVFVNAIGTGYSQAIAPNTNASFWGVDADAAVFRDFVQRYIEANARQSSPKYLYGESYGGTRSGVLASLLEAAGVHLEAVILQSPALNYNDDCVANAIPLCGVQLPTLAATALNFQLAPKSVTTLPDYMQQMREFNAQRYAPAVFKLLTQNLAAPPDLLNLLSTYAGLSANDWSTHLDMNPVYYRRTLKPGFVLGRLDSRLFVESTSALAANGADPSFDYIKPAFANTIASYLHDNLKYWNNSRYVVESDAISSWNFRHAGQDGPDVIPDLGAAMSLNPKLRVLNVNGYHDLATPFHWSELELARLNLPGRIFVRNYPGGHMTYLDDATRQQQYQDLLAFYRGTLPAVQLSMAAPPLESSSANLMQKNAQTVQQAVQQTAQLAPGLTVPPGSFVSSKPAGWRPSRTDSPRSANRAPDLQDEITARLRQHFARAAVLGEAGVSRAQLQAAGLTAIAEHFEEIDRTHRGRIYFEEWRNYLQGRQAIPQ
jgi:carboxypeptidase C (cathepsin A)